MWASILKEVENSRLYLKTSTAITNVPAKIHIVTDANVVTQITEDEIMDEIDEANSFLANSFLEITVCEDVNYIANNQLYFLILMIKGYYTQIINLIL